MDASPLGADGRMPLALRGLGLVGEGGHVLRAVDDLVRGGDGIWLGDGDRFELVLGLDRPIDGKVEGVVNIARICHVTSVGVGPLRAASLRLQPHLTALAGSTRKRHADRHGFETR